MKSGGRVSGGVVRPAGSIAPPGIRIAAGIGRTLAAAWGSPATKWLAQAAAQPQAQPSGQQSSATDAAFAVW